MFKSLLDYTKELETNAVATQEFIKKLRAGIKRVEKNIAKANQQVAIVKNPDKYVKSLLPAIEKDVLKTAKDIVQGQMLVAIRDNYEFDWPLYRRALFLAAADKDAYKVYNLGGTGWNTRLTFTINLDKTAGRLEAWARGVKLTRKALQVKVPRKGSKKREVTAAQASRAWAGIFGSRSSGKNDRFSQTVRLRLQYSGQVAPFWQLLDKGQVPMASDRGGYATPKGKPTNFINNSQQIMENYTRNILRSYKNNYQNLLSQYDVALEEMEAALVRLYDLSIYLNLTRESVQKVEQAYSKDLPYINGTKLAKAVQLILEGTAVGTAEGRIEVSAGSGKRIRPSINKIKGLLY